MFRRLSRPWFNFEYRDGVNGGEDWFFMRAASRAGIPVYVDHDASRLLRHIGEIEIGTDSTFSTSHQQL